MIPNISVVSFWKWGLAFFVCVFVLVMFAQVTYMPTKIVLVLLAGLTEFFIFLWSFLKIYRWIANKMERWASAGLPLDYAIITISKFLVGVSLFLLLQIPFLFIFSQILIFTKSLAG